MVFSLVFLCVSCSCRCLSSVSVCSSVSPAVLHACVSLGSRRSAGVPGALCERAGLRSAGCAGGDGDQACCGGGGGVWRWQTGPLRSLHTPGSARGWAEQNTPAVHTGERETNLWWVSVPRGFSCAECVCVCRIWWTRSSWWRRALSLRGWYVRRPHLIGC